MSRPAHDVVVVGAGIVGLSVARALEQRYAGIDVAVVEKEDGPGRHQTGHNSGVIHSGLYYPPGSLKARLCVAGRRRILEFCDEKGIPVAHFGKLVVAVADDRVPALETLHERGVANGLKGLDRLGPEGIRNAEPAVRGVAGLWVPETAVTDFSAVAAHLAGDLTGRIVTGAPVTEITTTSNGIRIRAGDELIDSRALVNCAGLHTDRVARLAGAKSSHRIVPFRGEYYSLRPGRESLVKGLIYPVPDPRFPFLGVHFTRRLDGTVDVGPNAVLALSREHYRGALPSVRDIWETLSFPGFWRIVARYWRTGAQEMWRSLRASSYAQVARALVPDLGSDDLIRGGAGVRAQAVARDGRLLDDFEIATSPHAIHVLNAPSPAATSSLAIGDHIAPMVGDLLQPRFR